MEPVRLQSMGFSRQEYWSELPCLPPRFLSNPEIKPASSGAHALQAESLPAELQENMEHETGSKSVKEYVKAVYCHPAYLTYMQSTS